MASRVDASVYKSLIGILLYFSATRPNIMYSASLLSRFMQSLSQVHYGMAKRVLRYIIVVFSPKIQKSKMWWFNLQLKLTITKNLVQHGRTKHINVKFYVVREVKKLGVVNLMHCNFEYQIPDIMTKDLLKAMFEFLGANL
ncbi:uncharacterized protein LOC111301868 [Durio zibethinus]|uniref:Uncharacterized protein LOC111301868 n=1 Tax=Durio zibethinus TaxID=66656 RepID=A0A6P5ZMQ4_DURZI|nr:uncharacterized protein LOC111301868 [Durio zibethinus]